MIRVMLLTAAVLLISGGVSNAQDACRVDQVLMPGDSCTVDIPGVSTGSNEFRVTSDGQGCYGSICAGQLMNLSGFRASKIEGTSNWRIDALPQTVPALPILGQLIMALLLGGAYLLRRRRH